jgi:D-alanyl-D-alanine carboxypeptidase
VLALPAGLLALAEAFTASGRADRAPEPKRLVDGLVAAGAPGAVVLVRAEERSVVAAAGLANREEGRPMRPDDRFRIGSITKTLVAAIVLQLVEEGSLALADRVDDWVPHLLPNGEEITLRHLLQHTSGLPDYVDVPALRSGATHGPRELIELALTNSPARDTPGTRFSYASTNYLVLQLVIEAATGSTLAHELERRIFRPLKLDHSSFAPLRISGSHARGYRAPSHAGIVTGAPVPTTGKDAAWAWGAGAVVSNADDLAHIFRALLGGGLVTPERLEEMRSVVPAGRNKYGLCLASFPTPCGTAWGHTGTVGGYVTVAWNLANASRQAVLMINTYPLPAELEEELRRAQIAAFCGSRPTR